MSDNIVGRDPREFEYLLNAMERAAQETNPANHGYGDKRRAVLAYVSRLEARAESAEAEAKRLTALINTPELHDFIKAVPLEAVHQRERWGTDHDDGKTPADWFWLIGYLAGKALRSHLDGDTKKALHHTITAAAAALANWHSAILGKTNMRPGIADPESARTALAKREGGEG